MTQEIWETIDNLFKTVHRQARLVEELEGRLAELERRQNDRLNAVPSRTIPATGELHIERAA